MNDLRNIETGTEIPSEGYCDQPYVVKLTDGGWLCLMTTGSGREGDTGQHIVATRSGDRGKTWSSLVDIEPSDGPEASWVMPLITPGGRVYAFYTYNGQNLREVIADEPQLPGGKTNRVDTLGEYAFKFSDDGGTTWSERYTIPVREMDIDRGNPYQGAVRFFWGVGKPITVGDTAYFGFAKVGRLGHGFMAESEGCFMRSDNILSEPDPDKIVWETLPEGDHGLRSPEGPIADEANLTSLSDGSLFCTYRTISGYPCHAYSRDRGRKWTDPAYMTYGLGGPPISHPRAANFVRKLAEGRHAGKYLYWFHNNNAKWYNQGDAASSRNPAWLLGGVEEDGQDGKVIRWRNPEVVLYSVDLHTGISYPDFVEEGDDLYITETQKTVARVHHVDRGLIDRLYG